MNYQLILRMVGRTLLLKSACLLLPLFTALYYGETILPFLYTIAIILVVAIPLSVLKSNSQFFAKEGFVIVASIWVLFCLFGSLPLYFSGHFNSYVDCLFEITSGFTTTGASILTDIEALPRGILLWRSFSSWLGGMGVLILTLAFLPNAGKRAHNIMQAESPGPVKNKFVPKTSSSSKILYSIYVILTVAEIVALCIAGMPAYDSIVHSFATICTGGFSIKNTSIGAYNSATFDTIISIFIVLSAINFSYYFLLVTKRVRSVLSSDELRTFIGILFVSITLITINLFVSSHDITQQGLGTTLRYVSFQVFSIASTTGFSTADFNLWPQFSRILLLILMVIGGCAGSTAGGIKVSRFLLLSRSISRDLKKLSHPRSLKVVKLDGKVVDDPTIERVLVFFACHATILAITCLIVSLDNFSFTTTVTAVFASIGNIGPGLDLVGPMGNYATFSDLSKIALSLCMLIGRLEIFPILILFMPSTWRNS